jgi:anti-anti-sigma regulatory factor
MKIRRPALSMSIESSGDIFPPKDGDVEECQNCEHEYIIREENPKEGMFKAAAHRAGNILRSVLNPEQEFRLVGKRLQGRCPTCKATLIFTAASARKIQIEVYPKQFCKFHRRRKRKEKRAEKFYTSWRRASHAAAHREPFVVINAQEDYVVGIIQHESLDEDFIRHYVEELQPLVDAKQRVVILDLCILQMLHGASDAMLLNLWRRLREQGRELRLACPQDAVLKKLTHGKLISVFHCYSSLQDAISVINRIV